MVGGRLLLDFCVRGGTVNRSHSGGELDQGLGEESGLIFPGRPLPALPHIKQVNQTGGEAVGSAVSWVCKKKIGTGNVTRKDCNFLNSSFISF